MNSYPPGMTCGRSPAASTNTTLVPVANVAFELALQMRRLPQVANIVSSTALDRPELRIYPRRDLAVRLGVSTESLSETIRVATIGDVGPALARYDAGTRSVPIRVSQSAAHPGRASTGPAKTRGGRR